MINSYQEKVEFFYIQGTLRPDAPSYIERTADTELFEHVLNSKLCYVLTSRQMGKSSLMVRTAFKLQNMGVKVATIDLTAIGSDSSKITPEAWYLALVDFIATELNLSIDWLNWWQQKIVLGPVRAFTKFLEEVVLQTVTEQIVIFIDEIDYMLTLDFSDDFFAAIRAIHNARASKPIYNRLTFTLLGSASPSDLIKDEKKTPFNVGQAITLQEFSRVEVHPLEDELAKVYPNEAKLLVDRIFYWTNGHPYLTQQLCLEVANNPNTTWNKTTLDDLVTELFLTDESILKNSHLQYIQKRILQHPKKENLLWIYRLIYNEKKVVDEVKNLLHNELKLSGLVSRNKKGQLIVRNSIYKNVFDEQWIKANMLSWTQEFVKSLRVIILLYAVLFIFTIIFSYTASPNPIVWILLGVFFIILSIIGAGIIAGMNFLIDEIKVHGGLLNLLKHWLNFSNKQKPTFYKPNLE